VRHHGRNGLVYLSVHNGDLASALAYQSAWSIDFVPDKVETTTFTSTQRTWIAAMPDVSGTFTGFCDDATSQTYMAATDGLPRSMYLYPDSRNLGQYFSGTVLADLATTGGVTTAVGVTANWVAAGPVGRTDDYGTYSDTYTDPYG